MDVYDMFNNNTIRSPNEPHVESKLKISIYSPTCCCSGTDDPVVRLTTGQVA